MILWYFHGTSADFTSKCSTNGLDLQLRSEISFSTIWVHDFGEGQPQTAWPCRGSETLKPFELQTAAITSRLDPRSASIMVKKKNQRQPKQSWQGVIHVLKSVWKKDIPPLSEIDVLKHVQLFVPVNLWMGQHDNTLIVLSCCRAKLRSKCTNNYETSWATQIAKFGPDLFLLKKP